MTTDVVLARPTPPELAAFGDGMGAPQASLAQVARAWGRSGPANAAAWYEDALVQWLATSQSEHTRRSYGRTVKHFFEWLSRHKAARLGESAPRLVAPHEVTLGDVTAYASAISGEDVPAYADLEPDPIDRSLLRIVRELSDRIGGAVPFGVVAQRVGGLLGEDELSSRLGRLAQRHLLHRLPKMRDPEIANLRPSGAIVRPRPFEPLDPAIFSFSPITKKAPAQPSTVAQRLAALSSFFEAMARPNPALGESPVKGNPIRWELKKWESKRRENAESRTMARKTQEDDFLLLLKLVDEVPGLAPARRARDRFILLTLYMMGLRISELVRAKNADLNEKHPSGPVLRVRRKGNKVQDLGVPATVMQALRVYRDGVAASTMPEAWKTYAQRPDAPLVSALHRWGNAASRARGDAPESVEGRARTALVPLSEEAVREMLRAYVRAYAPGDEAQQRALFERIHPHGLRHLFAAKQLEKSPIQVVQKYMAHASPATTGIYAPKVDTTKALGEDALLGIFRDRPSPEVNLEPPPVTAVPPPAPPAPASPAPEAQQRPAPKAKADPPAAETARASASPPKATEAVTLTAEEPPRDVRPPLEPEPTIQAVGDLGPASPSPTAPAWDGRFPAAPAYAYQREPELPGTDGRTGSRTVSALGLPVALQNERIATGDATLLPYRVYRGPVRGQDKRYVVPIPRVESDGSGGLDDLAQRLMELHEQWQLGGKPTAARALVLWTYIVLGAGARLEKARAEAQMSWLRFDEPLASAGAKFGQVKARYVRAHDPVAGVLPWLEAYGGKLSGSFDPKRDLYEYQVQRKVEERYHLEGTEKGHRVGPSGERVRAGAPERTREASEARKRPFAGLGWIDYALPDWMLVDDPLADAEHGIPSADRQAFEGWLFAILHTRAPVHMPDIDGELENGTLREVLATLGPFVEEANRRRADKKGTVWMEPATRERVRTLCSRLSGGTWTTPDGRTLTTFDPYALAVSQWRPAAFAIAGEVDPYEGGVPLLATFDVSDPRGVGETIFTLLGKVEPDGRGRPRVVNRYEPSKRTIVFSESDREDVIASLGVDPELVTRRVVRLLWERRKELVATSPRGTDMGSAKAAADFDVALTWMVPAPHNIEQATSLILKKRGTRPSLSEMRAALGRISQRFRVDDEPESAGRSEVEDEFAEQQEAGAKAAVGELRRGDGVGTVSAEAAGAGRRRSAMASPEPVVVQSAGGNVVVRRARPEAGKAHSHTTAEQFEASVKGMGGEERRRRLRAWLSGLDAAAFNAEFPKAPPKERRLWQDAWAESHTGISDETGLAPEEAAAALLGLGDLPRQRKGRFVPNAEPVVLGPRPDLRADINPIAEAFVLFA